MASDVSAVRVAATGNVGVGPARIRSIHVLTAGGNGRLTITDGSGGSVVLDVDFSATDTNFISVPDMGIRCSVSMVVTAFTNITAATILYS